MKNDGLNLFRKRLRSGPSSAVKEPLKLKDWVTVALSTLALLTSAGAAYYNIVRKSENVRVQLQGNVLLLPDASEADAHVKAEFTATFVNAGNRGAVISSVDLFLLRRHAKAQEKCEGEEEVVNVPPILLRFNLDPFVMRAEDLVVKEIALRPDLVYPTDVNGWIVVPMEQKRKVHSRP